MNTNYKLYFKYILFTTNQFFFKTNNYNLKNINVCIFQKNLYYLLLHFKLSSFFYSIQLMDIFSYETPININTDMKKNQSIANLTTNIIVYNFHIIFNQQRIFLFLLNSSKQTITKNLKYQTNLNSITELFLNANWLEREVSELHGIFFYYKKDIRNLMLQYGDTSTPLLKSFPSIGTREIFYDIINDNLFQTTPSIQF